MQSVSLPLPPRERRAVDLAISDKFQQEIVFSLGVQEKTIKVDRAHRRRQRTDPGPYW